MMPYPAQPPKASPGGRWEIARRWPTQFPWGNIYTAINHGEIWNQGPMKKNAPIEWEEVQKETGQPMLTWFLHGMERGDQVEMTPRRSLLLTGTWETRVPRGARPHSSGQQWAMRLLFEHRASECNGDWWTFNNCSASQQKDRTWDLREGAAVGCWRKDKSGICLLEMSVLSVSCEVISSDPLLMYSRHNFIAICN